MSDIRNHFAVELRAARQAAGMTQEDLAGATGTSVDFLSKLERGLNSPSLETLAALVKALSLDPAARLSDSKVLDSIAIDLRVLQSNLQKGYQGLKGGHRDHDLGWVIMELALVYERAGGILTSGVVNVADVKPYEASHKVDSKFIRFMRAFHDRLPENPLGAHGKIGRLLHEHRKAFKTTK